jgi:hypothetical protein
MHGPANQEFGSSGDPKGGDCPGDQGIAPVRDVLRVIAILMLEIT